MGLRARGELGGVDYQWDNGAALLYTHWDRDYPGNVPEKKLDKKLNSKKCIFERRKKKDFNNYMYFLSYSELSCLLSLA